MTSIGKYRHLGRATTAEGHFVVMAIDHRTNLRQKLDQHAPQPLADEQFVRFKQQVIAALAPHSSAVLTDPAYGIGRGVATGALPGSLGLLAPVEVTDYSQHPSQRTVEFIPAWSVAKIKRMGGDGVKLLLPYHPEDSTTAEKHILVQQIVSECARHDLPFYLEPIPYSPNPGQPLPNDERLAINVQMCRTFSEMGVDVLKLPFPLDAAQSADVGAWRAACNQVDAACTVPWALLSAGVDFETFLRQSEIACQAGASGVIVGRAVWGEATRQTREARQHFLAETAATRMRQLAAVCAQHAMPWQVHTPPPDDRLDWYERYESTDS